MPELNSNPTRAAVKVARELERAQARARKTRMLLRDQLEAIHMLKRELRLLTDAAELPIDAAPADDVL